MAMDRLHEHQGYTPGVQGNRVPGVIMRYQPLDLSPIKPHFKGLAPNASLGCGTGLLDNSSVPQLQGDPRAEKNPLEIDEMEVIA